ncbi:MAG: membrane protein insertase YidC [Ilumatobacter sp.]
MFEIPAGLLSWFYGLTGSSLTIAIALMSVVVMAITTPLTLKSTKGMLEMQRLSPEMKRLQNEYRDDRQKLNEEMMKLYQEHKVNPASSCLPIFAQMPVFIVMFRVLRGLAYNPADHADVAPIANAVSAATGDGAEFDGFIPRYLSPGSELFQAIYQDSEIRELGLDLSISPFEAIQNDPLVGIVYALLVVALGGLYFGQQRMVAARAAVSPTMSPTQQKLMQYLPVVFAVFQIFFLTALVVYYIFQTLLRILQQYYVTKKFYGHDESLGRQAQRAGEAARAQSKDNGEPQGFFEQAKRELSGGRDSAPKKPESGGKNADGKKNDSASKGSGRPTGQSKRVTPPKSRPTSPRNGSAPGKGRPTPSRQEAQANKSRPKKSGKKKR